MQISAFTAGLNTFQSAVQRTERAAADIAQAALPHSSSTRDSADLATSMVQLDIGTLQAQAGAKLLQTADDVLGTLLDTHA
ncbi:hypothetical protein NVV93_18325 [Pseudomonas sp. LS44]|uniref:hypothetical protein n=1 Tax=Pseudomonas sp. LS44 TaxID=1357074 RepID=UPI00215A81BC|nr:hypothetical protein [Pseudomonas sp. LS44]UVE17500.1 hypothetical protein NVV93_18325 [Pseudomonas sp. LS44]